MLLFNCFSEIEKFSSRKLHFAQGKTGLFGKQLFLKSQSIMILRCSILNQPNSLTLVVPLTILLIPASLLLANEAPLAQADDSVPAPALDLGALANLAQNPQVISIVSSLLNQSGQKSPPAPNLDSSSSDLPPDIQNSIIQDNFPTSSGQSAGEPLRRNSKTSSPTSAASSASTTTGSTSPPATANPSPQPSLSALLSSLKFDGVKNGGLGSLMSMLPSLLPNLGSILSAVAGPKTNNSSSAAENNKAVNLTTSEPPLLSSPPPPPSPSSPVESATSSSGGGTAATSTTSVQGGASGAISQVIAAYASGQIPNELIQMTLAGKIPIQVIDLALTGQLPPQLVQMAVTGQIPVSTLKALFEGNGGSGQVQANAGAPAVGTTTQQTSSTRAEPIVYGRGSSSADQRGMTRALLETLFRYQKDPEGKRSIHVPTLLGSVPVQLPNLPRVRHIGQIVGGTITSVANLIPF